MVHPWFSGLAQHRWTEPCPQKRKKFILNSVFLIVKKDCQKAVWGVLSLPPFPITLLKQKGSQLGDFPAATATISQQPRVKTKRWHKGLCSSFIPQLSACLCHPPCSPPPIKPFTSRNSGKKKKKKALIPLSLQHQPHRLRHTSIVKIKETGPSNHGAF